MRTLALGVALFFSGCVSTSTMGLARTLNKGAVQGWVGGGAFAPVPPNDGRMAPLPMVEAGVRTGVTDRVELGARAGLAGIGLEGKFALARASTMDRGVNVSLSPQASVIVLPSGGLWGGNVAVSLPLLIGIDFAGHELIIGPRLHDMVGFGGLGDLTYSVNVLSAGLSLGVAIKVGPVRIVPEVSALMPFHTAAFGSPGELAVKGVVLQAGVGVLLGSADAYEQRR